MPRLYIAVKSIQSLDAESICWNGSLKNLKGLQCFQQANVYKGKQRILPKLIWSIKIQSCSTVTEAGSWRLRAASHHCVCINKIFHEIVDLSNAVMRFIAAGTRRKQRPKVFKEGYFSFPTKMAKHKTNSDIRQFDVNQITAVRRRRIITIQYIIPAQYFPGHLKAINGQPT